MSPFVSGTRRILCVALITFAVPTARAQIITLPDPQPPKTVESFYAGGRLTRAGTLSQFDSLGGNPMAQVGDTVTVYLFPDGAHLERIVHARVATRQRFQPPVSWRAACDEIAHPGWLYALAPTNTAPFAVVVHGIYPAPIVREPPPFARAGAWQFFFGVADSAWQRYRAFLHPTTARGELYEFTDYWGTPADARYSITKMFGVRGPNGTRYAAFSFAMHDDYPKRPNTARTWVVDAWGYPVAQLIGNIDVYGVINDGGIDAIVTSSGLIHWDGTKWRFPDSYSEEPCLFHQIMNPPPGAHP